MSAPTVATSMFTARANLLALLKADPDLQDVQIRSSHPGHEIAQEAIFFANVEQQTEVAQTMGTQRQREETYPIEVWVDVVRDSNDPDIVEGRLAVLAARVEVVLRQYPDLDNAVNIRAELVGMTLEHYISENGGQRGCRSLMKIECHHWKVTQ